MLEMSLEAAQDAVADRLYSPLILANLGILDGGVAQQITATVGQILAFVAGLVAIPNVVTKQNTAD